MVVDADIRPSLIRLWMDSMEDVLGHPLTSEQAGRLLGKSARMIRYYEEGREIPKDTRLLMDALAQGYTPRAWGLK
jgi:hypothetical protein